MTLPTQEAAGSEADAPATALGAVPAGRTELKRRKLAAAAPTANIEGTRATGSNSGPTDFEWFGQKFVRSRADGATWAPAGGGWERRDCGVHAATAGVASVNVVRAGEAGAASASYPLTRHVQASYDAQKSDIQFHYVLEGEATLTTTTTAGGEGEARSHTVSKGDAWVVPVHADDGMVCSLDTVGGQRFSMIEVWMSRA